MWALQVLAGIEVIAPELGLRPHLPSIENRQLALAHPVIAELREQGAVDESGEVDPPVVEWLTVLSRRDAALFVQCQPPSAPTSARALLARYAHWWVVMERSADLVRIRGAGAAVTEDAANAVLGTQLEWLCGAAAPAPLRPVTTELAAMRTAAVCPKTLRRFLLQQGLEADQLQLLMSAVDARLTVQTSVVAIQSGLDTGRPTRAHIEGGAVTVIDTPAGRLVAEQVASAGRTWMIISPGTANSIASAVTRMVRRLPAQDQWHSYRKAV
ncbi:ESX secretion-associated protein EspG [Mycobacterium sp. MFM001]|uniref:ESX secretion-associated protein EspG n=1 Tax=Mycobacterium sp. MFM001 TaxID=2049453 RepID=UPI001EDD2C50|nr:ESX secretion-associated protein EspG [Mycobacterium sp. MFM001]